MLRLHQFLTIGALLLSTTQTHAEEPFDRWYKFRVNEKQTLSKIFRTFVRGGLEAKSYDTFITEVVKKNPDIKDFNKIYEKQIIILPIRATGQEQDMIQKKQMPESVSQVAELKPASESILSPNPDDSQPSAQTSNLAEAESAAFFLGPVIGYSRVDIVETQDDSETKLLSRRNVGMTGTLRFYNSERETIFKFLTFEHKYEKNQTKPFESDKVRLHNLDLDRVWQSQSGFRYGLGLLFSESVYLSALDTTSLVIDPVFQPGVSWILGYRLDWSSFAWQFEVKPSYLFSSHASTFRVRYGSKYIVENVFDFKVGENWSIPLKIWYGEKNLKSSISTQDVRDTGISIGVEFR